MDTKKLRQKILDLAIRGKLVPQDPNDEPASVLLERIRAEKERLVKEGKIKKSKAAKTSDTPHYEQVPSGWDVTNIGELLINRDGERKPVSSAIRSKQENKIYDYYGAAGVIDKVDDYIFNERLLLIGEDGANLLSRSKDNAFFAEGKYWVNNHAHVLDATDKSLLDYVAIVINAIKLDDYVTGSAQPKLSQDNLNKIPIFLPPLEEQKRILAEIGRWFALIDNIEQEKVNLQATIKQAKSKILDLAIHGKLVPQHPNDEPASELLKRINPAAEITCDNGQYGKVPKGWCLCRLGDIGEIVTGNTPTKDIAEYYGGSIPFYKPTDLDKGKCVENASDNLSFLGFEQSRKIPANSILVTCIGATIGKTGLITVEGSCNQQINAIIPNDAAFAEFVYYTCISDYLQKEIKLNASATTLPILNKSNFAKLLFPLPPLAEQRRIVAKIEELFSLLDNIQKALEV